MKRFIHRTRYWLMLIVALAVICFIAGSSKSLWWQLISFGCLIVITVIVTAWWLGRKSSIKKMYIENIGSSSNPGYDTLNLGGKRKTYAPKGRYKKGTYVKVQRDLDGHYHLV